MNDAFVRTAEFCHKNLMKSLDILEYLHDIRGLSDESLSKFLVGLFPQDMCHLFRHIPANELRMCGLIKNASHSMFKTWNLVMPIFDTYGSPIAFAGRTLLSGRDRAKRRISKYMNTSYLKTRNLFGLHMAKRNILKSDTVYVVEGYFDVIKAHQENITNVVGCCGTSLSGRQIAILSRYASKIILLFDNDEAGRRNAALHVERKRYSGVTMMAKNPFPPEVKDLDDFLSLYSATDFLEAMCD
jgi:DNA primase